MLAGQAEGMEVVAADLFLPSWPLSGCTVAFRLPDPVAIFRLDLLCAVPHLTPVILNCCPHQPLASLAMASLHSPWELSFISCNSRPQRPEGSALLGDLNWTQALPAAPLLPRVKMCD